MSLVKKIFYINGANRQLIVDTDESLADALRRIGLTGTKVSCRKGVCGACSVVINGKVTRSCLTKAAKLDDFTEIVTIEGIGTPMHPHPLQLAFVTYGAIQCGFCTPGFIVSAYALLLENPNPTREEVREQFQKNRNVCRCTGYKQIVDAVMEAAKVLRGEATMDDIAFKATESYFNTRTPRPSGLAKACGVLDYGEDVALKMPEGTLHLAVVMPQVAHHARIISIDISEAEKMPGVEKIILAADIPGNLMPGMSWHPRTKIKGPQRSLLNDKTIFRYGDVIAVVAADTRAHARAAAAAVKMEYEVLAEYTNLLDAVAPDARQIHEGVPNTYMMQPVVKGEETRDIIDASAFSVSGSFRSPREPHLSVEGDIVQAYFDDEGVLCVHCKSQSIYGNVGSIANALGLPREKVRIIHNGVGGSFGWATEATSFSLTGAMVVATGKPCSLAMSYEEFMHFSGKRTSAMINGRLSCDDKGKINALEFDIGIDHGSYFDNADAILGKLSCVGVPYMIPNVRGLVRMVATNQNYGTAYRGFGFPQNTTAMEALIDMLADAAGIDPFEMRAINTIRDGELTTNQVPLHDYVYEEMYNLARDDYYKLKKQAQEESTDEIKKGVGVVSLYFNPMIGSFDSAESALELMPNGKFRVSNTWQDVGQGGDVGSLVFALEALKELNLTPDDIIIDINDSKYSPNTGISASSRSHYMGGNAIIDSANKMLAAMKKPDGTYRTYDEMKAEGIDTRYIGHHDLSSLGLGGLDANTGAGSSAPTGMYGVCIGKVAVNVNTGKVVSESFKMWADAGVIGNYNSAEGQAYGGLSHNVGFALSEDYDDVKKHDNLFGAGVPYALDVPDDMEIVWLENKRPGGPFGSSGLSELFQCGQHMVIINAIAQATGARVYELPAYPEKVKAALAAKAAGNSDAPESYYLGSDFYDEMDDIIAHPVQARR